MANKLKFLRKTKKLTQNEIAKLINMSYSNYSKLEREEIAITSDQLKILSDFYGVSISFLLDDYKREVVISKEQYLKLIDMNEILREIIDQNAAAVLGDEQNQVVKINIMNDNHAPLILNNFGKTEEK